MSKLLNMFETMIEVRKVMDKIDKALDDLFDSVSNEEWEEFCDDHDEWVYIFIDIEGSFSRVLNFIDRYITEDENGNLIPCEEITKALGL